MDEPSQNQESSSETPRSDDQQAAASPAPSDLSFLRSGYSPSSSRLSLGSPAAPRSLSTAFQLPKSTFGGPSLEKRFSLAPGDVRSSDGTPIEIEQETHDRLRHTERLKTGDTWRQEPDQETLEMKNKDRLIIYRGLGWIMEDKNHNPITRALLPGIHNGPDSGIYTLHRGDSEIGTARELFGVTTIQFTNGDKIVFDSQGLASVSRRKDSFFVREPVRKQSMSSPRSQFSS